MPAGSRGNFLSALLGAGLVAAVFAGLAVTGTFDDRESAVTVTSTPSQDMSPPPDARTVTDVSELYKKVSDGVVYVQTSSRSPVTSTDQESGSGSGFVLDGRGYILTNDHVVANADTVRVRIGASEDLMSAKVIGTDASSDLAVLKVDPDGVAGGLKPLTLGSSDSVEVGQPAVAIGSPFGLQGSLTTGVISALGRPIQSPNGFQISGALQTDAAINPGNSGGPLLDAQGDVIGINAQIATETQSNSGVGFAIPIDIAKQSIEQLERGETIRRAYLGVSTASTANGTGAQIAAVVGGGPAAKAGLRAGDRITAVSGQDVKTADDVAERIADRKPGDVIEVVVQRSGDAKTVKVTLGTQPKSATQAG
jgi:S1-C subfamily serine protease